MKIESKCQIRGLLFKENSVKNISIELRKEEN